MFFPHPLSLLPPVLIAVPQQVGFKERDSLFPRLRCAVGELEGTAGVRSSLHLLCTYVLLQAGAFQGALHRTAVHRGGGEEGH